jgi:hypothetical protein
MILRSAALVPVLLLAAALSADGAKAPLVADNASAAVSITKSTPVQFFTSTPARNETVTFIYTCAACDFLQAHAKRGACPTDLNYDFRTFNARASNEGRGDLDVDPCSGEGEICFGVPFYSSNDEYSGPEFTAAIPSSRGAMSVVTGETVPSASLLDAMNNLKATLTSDFEPAASKP